LPGINFYFLEKLATHCSPEEKGDKEANKPIKEKRKKKNRNRREK